MDKIRTCIEHFLYKTIKNESVVGAADKKSFPYWEYDECTNTWINRVSIKIQPRQALIILSIIN